ncbi:MAG: hypothetical protein IKZ96_03725 [Bacilli bacterium]|nr:hypothetical protein [Bacilli bacterium]
MNNIMLLLEEIEYGYKDVNNKYHNSVDNDFSDNYRLQSPSEIEESKLGVCWDQVEYERYLLDKQNIKNTTYFIVHYDNDKCPTHTFLIYEDNNKYYWFEHAWEKFKGIHEYDTEEDALKDIKEKFIKCELNNNYINKNLCIYKYDKPEYGISVSEFYKHCEKGENIII